MSKNRFNPSDYKKGDIIFLGGNRKITNYLEVVESGKNKDLVFRIMPGHNRTREQVIRGRQAVDYASNNPIKSEFLGIPEAGRANVVNIGKDNKLTETRKIGYDFKEVPFNLKDNNNNKRKGGSRYFVIASDNKVDTKRFNNNISYIKSGQRKKDLETKNWDRAVAGREGMINDTYGSWDTESLIREYNKLTKKGKDRTTHVHSGFPGAPLHPITTFDKTARRDAEALGEYLITKRNIGGINKGEVYDPKSNIDPWLGGINFIMPDGFEPLPFNTDQPSIVGIGLEPTTGFDYKDAYKIDNIMSMGFNDLDLGFGSYEKVKNWQAKEQNNEPSTEELNTGKTVTTDTTTDITPYAAEVKKKKERLEKVDTQGTTQPNFGTFESGGITNTHYTNKNSLQILNP